MKTNRFKLITASSWLIAAAALLAPPSLSESQAASILFVSDDFTLEQGFVDYLEGNHSVNTALAGSGQYANGGVNAAVADTFDVVIIGKNTGGGSDTGYDGADTAAWASIAAPIIAVNNYTVSSDAWGWMDGGQGDQDFSGSTISSILASDPIWAGVTVPALPANFLYTGNTRSSRSNPALGGVKVAEGQPNSNPDATVIARWAAGQAGAGARVYFAEGDPASSAYNLNDQGEIAFENAIQSFTIPEPSSLALLLLGGIGAIARRSSRRQ